MTLEEAHKIQRRELMSLRAENKRLKRQLSDDFPIEEKESLLRRIRHLEQIVNTNAKKHKSAHKRWKYNELRCNSLIAENDNLKKQILVLSDENASLKVRAETAEAEVRMLNGTNKKLEKRINTNFENSSLPSSALPFRKKVPNNRKPSSRKPGGQPGHKPHTAKRLTPTKEAILLPTPKEFATNPDIYPTGKLITKQLIDIKIHVDVQDFIAEEYRNRITGTRLHAPFPKGLFGDVNYGSSIKAFAFLLNNYYNVPVAKTSQFISDLTKGVVTLSTGTICNLSTHFSNATSSERAKIFSLLTHADILYSDATTSNVNGSRKAVILCTDKENVLYQHTAHKGHDGLSKTPVNNYDGILIHDHDRSYYSYGSNHQECLAHVLRYLIGATENESHLTWHKKMHSFLQKMIHTVKRNKRNLSKEKIAELTKRYESILNLASLEYEEHPPDKSYMDGYNLYKRMRDYKDNHLFFLSHPDVDYTNNISERELRKFKRKQKQAVVFRSDSGAQHICDALTIIETARMQNKNVIDIVTNSFEKH